MRYDSDFSSTELLEGSEVLRAQRGSILSQNITVGRPAEQHGPLSPQHAPQKNDHLASLRAVWIDLDMGARIPHYSAQLWWELACPISSEMFPFCL